MRTLVASAVAALLVAFAASASGHALDVSTSKVTLRDDHVEIAAEWDLFLLAGATPTEIATQPDDALARTLEALVRSIEADTHLAVDGAPRALVAKGLPAAAELRALAAQLSASGHDHGTLVRFRLEAMGEARSPRKVTVVSPAKLGPVLTSFVQPQMRYAQAAEASTFDVLGAPQPPAAVAAPPPRAPTPPPSAERLADTSRWPLLVGLATAVVGALVSLRPRSPSRNEP